VLYTFIIEFNLTHNFQNNVFLRLLNLWFWGSPVEVLKDILAMIGCENIIRRSF